MCAHQARQSELLPCSQTGPCYPPGFPRLGLGKRSSSSKPLKLGVELLGLASCTTTAGTISLEGHQGGGGNRTVSFLTHPLTHGSLTHPLTRGTRSLTHPLTRGSASGRSVSSRSKSSRRGVNAVRSAARDSSCAAGAAAAAAAVGLGAARTCTQGALL